MKTLHSYLEGRWVAGDGPGAALHDATTGAAIAQASTRGLDLGGAVRHARDAGGAALRAMSFAERGALLEALSRSMHAARDELIEVARENSGNTRSDAKFDIDGASSTLAYYASLGKTLGDRRFLRDGASEPVLRSKRFVGQHLWVAREGVAIHVNAFNFPAWGLCEKAAVALLAGVPVIAKPATATAALAVRIVEIWVEQGLLPTGALSLVTGPVGDLLDHVGPQDCIAFTGSGDTGRLVKGHPAVLAANARVNVEADSLNASVLGPDVAPGSDTFEMFLADVARDVTQKAGQKCTAVRRVLVPEALVEAATEALVDRLSLAVVGDPAERATLVGPLASEAQQRDVQRGLEMLGGVAERVHTSPAPTGGFFVAPSLFVAASADVPFVHEHEVFGPAATIVPYSGDAQDAVRIVARGGGGLVASFYSDDLDFGATLLFGLAPWSGRVLWGSKKVHDQSPGPGTVLPNLVHGGPGKAGGGEELGGERGLHFYMQRTAVQADAILLERILGV